MQRTDWEDLDVAGIHVPIELQALLDEDPQAKAIFLAAEYDEQQRRAAQVAASRDRSEGARAVVDGLTPARPRG